jgi:hypothetical protein
MGNASSRADSDSSKSEDTDSLIKRIKEARRRKSDSYTMDTSSLRGIDVSHIDETDTSDERPLQQVMRPVEPEVGIRISLPAFENDIDRDDSSSCSSVDSAEYHIVDPDSEIPKNKIV